MRWRALHPGVIQRHSLDGEKIRRRERHPQTAPKPRNSRSENQPPTHIRHVGFEQPGKPWIEAYHTERAVISGKLAPECRNPPPDVAVDLDLEQQRGASAD